MAAFHLKCPDCSSVLEGKLTVLAYINNTLQLATFVRCPVCFADGDDASITAYANIDAQAATFAIEHNLPVLRMG